MVTYVVTPRGIEVPEDTFGNPLGSDPIALGSTITFSVTSIRCVRMIFFVFLQWDFLSLGIVGVLAAVLSLQLHSSSALTPWPDPRGRRAWAIRPD